MPECALPNALRGEGSVKGKHPDMRKRLQIALMLTATTATATSLSFSFFFASFFLASFFFAPRVWAAEKDNQASPVQSQVRSGMTTTGITTTEENGRKIFVNEDAPAAKIHTTAAPQTKDSTFVYWSSKENRWKPVPSANTASMQAARSAAAEVSEYFSHESVQSANARIIAANSAAISAANGRGHQASPDEIDASIAMAAARHNVDPNLVRAVVKVESNFNSNAVSRKGAMGLMQLMPATARSLNVKNPFDPDQNVDAGVRHLKHLLENYGGDLKLTLAAYNAGSGAVARNAGVPHFAETQNYVRRITDLYYGGFDFAAAGASHDPVHVQRDARGVLYISNTD
jgi:soluble lytic murein transglycosylase-like protein